MTTVLSSVPRQLDSVQSKLAWLVSTVETHNPDIAITPQEFFGGAVIMPQQKWFTKDELLPQLTKLAKRTSSALVVGVCEKLTQYNVESLWFIDESGEFVGEVRKLALPKYDHVATKGYGELVPELDWEQRFKTFELAGLQVAGVFCWEVYSTLLWAGLSVAKPDLIANCIKFGPNAWPQVKMENGRSVVKGFGYGGWSEQGGWIDRMKFAALWEVRCPIVSSTNSWNLRPISMPICGCWTGLDGQGPRSLWHPRKEDKAKQIPEKIVIDEIDRNRVRAVRRNKWAYKEAVGEFPPMSIARFTMLLKMARVEDRILSGSEEKSIKGRMGRAGGFGLC